MEKLYLEFDISEEEKPVVNEIFEDFVSAHYLNLPEVDERSILLQDNDTFLQSGKDEFPFEFIGFSVTKRCNFACRYCIAGANASMDTSQDFKEDKLLEHISRFADELISNGKTQLAVGFTGGEPLMYWDKLRPVLDEIYKKYQSKLDVKFMMNTNVSLVTPEIAAYFGQHKITISTSLDGVSEWNDKVRVYKGGAPTFDSIMTGVKNLRNHGVECKGFYLTLTKSNFDFDVDELFKFAVENEFSSITIEPDLVSAVEIDIDLICEKLKQCVLKGKELGINVVGFWKRPFENMKDYNETRKGFCRALDFKSIVVDRDGYISPCGYSTVKIAKVDKYADLVHNAEYMEFIRQNLRGNIEKCKDCVIEGICKGGCLISRETSQDNDEVFNYRCSIYLKMTDYLLEQAAFGE